MRHKKNFFGGRIKSWQHHKNVGMCIQNRCRLHTLEDIIECYLLGTVLEALAILEAATLECKTREVALKDELERLLKEYEELGKPWELLAP